MENSFRPYLKKALENTAEKAMIWLNEELPKHFAPEANRPTPYEIFGKRGKNSNYYENARNELYGVLDEIKKQESRIISGDTTAGTSDAYGMESVKEGLDHVAEASGLTAEGLLGQFLKQQYDDHKRAEAIKNPIDWSEFNGISKKLLGEQAPVNIKRLFREILNSKITLEKKSSESGSIDPGQFSRYYTGDIFVNEEESKPRVAVYVYADNSGSMRLVVGRGEMPEPGEQSRYQVTNEILQALFEVFYEAESGGLGVRWAYAIWAGKMNSITGEIEDGLTWKKKINQATSKAKIADLFGGIPEQATYIKDVVDSWKKISPEQNEKVIIFVLSDGVFQPWPIIPLQRLPRMVNGMNVSGVDPYEYIKRNKTPFTHVWIPISYDSTNNPAANAVFGGTSTSSKTDIYQAIARNLKKVLSQLF